MHQTDDVPGHGVEVEDGREGVQAGGVELVTVSHGQLRKGGKVPLVHRLNHLLHPVGDHSLSSVLHRDTHGEGSLATHGEITVCPNRGKS